MPTQIRVGFGYDIHALAEGESLIIGGENIPHTRGAVAHSDGDVLVHALADAILGAIGARDIGYHFPDTDPANKHLSWKHLLVRVMELASEKGYVCVNADCTIVAQKPKLAEHINTMRKNIAEVLQVHIQDVGLKATTNEKLGPEGREEGISAYAVCLMERQ